MRRPNWYERLPRPAIIAHRGASLDAPENTLAAFNLAISQGADAVEFDVMLCGSGEVVVIHDENLNRTTGGEGPVGDTPLDEIKQQDAGSWFDAEFAGETVPSLDEVLESIGLRTYLNIELKNFSSPFDDLADKTAAAVLQHQLQDRIFFSSFNPFNFRKIKRILPDSPVGLLTARGMANPAFLRLARLFGPYEALHPHVDDVTPEWIARSHKAGKPVFSYVCNEPDEILRGLSAGLDGLITDNPVLARSKLQAFIHS